MQITPRYRCGADFNGLGHADRPSPQWLRPPNGKFLPDSGAPDSTAFSSNPLKHPTGPPMTSLSVPYRLNSPARPSPWDSIDLDTVEVVDLTDPSARTAGTRRRPPSPSDQQPPSKKAKGKQPETYITLDDDDDEESDDDDDDDSGGPEPVPPLRLHSPSQSGTLSDVECVICLDSPTDLASTPCGHVFCDFCIRSALKAGTQAQRGRAGITVTGACPICRRKVNTKNLIPLEIKVRS